MSVTNYATVNGQILYEATAGVRTSDVHDALGSVIATTDSSGTVQNTYRYAPYGTKISKVGAVPDPKYGWIGGPGCRVTGRLHAEEYMRARVFGIPESRWTTVDPMWPLELAYGYSNLSPVTFADPTGRGLCIDEVKINISKQASDLAKCLIRNFPDKAGIAACTKKFGADVRDEEWDAMKSYMACKIAAKTCDAAANRLDVCEQPLNCCCAQSCCYELYVKSILDCMKKGENEIGLSICALRGYASFEECLGKHALDEANPCGDHGKAAGDSIGGT